MKVGELIRDSEWIPNECYDPAARPAVSILLPTFRRGRDGLFQRAVNSILSQQLQDFELIVVDDSSTDGTADFIRNFMQRDRRVNCIRHLRNVGLPAVSEFEAYQKARGEFIAFAFDDVVFEPDGLLRLLDDARQSGSHVCHGYMHSFQPSAGGNRTTKTLGKKDADGGYSAAKVSTPTPAIETNCLWRLKSFNFIGNSSFLVRTEVFEKVGFYDPHVTIARLCDWDLWVRILKHYPIDCCDVLVATEYGESRKDSLGKSYELNHNLIHDYMAVTRDNRLTSQAMPEYDVVAMPTGSDARLASYARECLRSFHSQGRLKSVPDDYEDDKSILVLYDDGVSFQLVYRGLSPELQRCFCLHYDWMNRDTLLPHLVKASAVLVCRRMDRFAALALWDDLRDLRVPVYFFLDENVFALAEQLPEYEFYRPAAFQAVASHLAGFVCCDHLLVDDIYNRGLSDNVIHWPPIYSPDFGSDAKMSPPSERMTIGIPGDGSRLHSILATLGAGCERTGMAPQVHTRRCVAAESATGLDIVQHDVESSWEQFIFKWRRLGIHALVQPAGNSVAAAYKSRQMLLVSYYLGSIPIVDNEAAYQGLDERHGVIHLGESSPQELQRVFGQLNDPSYREQLYLRLADFCRQEFAPDLAARAVRALLKNVPNVGAHRIEERWRVLDSKAQNKLHTERQKVVCLEQEVASLRESLSRLESAHREAPMATVPRPEQQLTALERKSAKVLRRVYQATIPSPLRRRWRFDERLQKLYSRVKRVRQRSPKLDASSS